MQEVRAIVLRAAGINTDLETEYALELAGAKADRVHINRLIEDKGLLDQYHILIFPGGFSYGDDVAAGKILANQVVHHLRGAGPQVHRRRQARARHLQRLPGAGQDRHPARRQRRSNRRMSRSPATTAASTRTAGCTSRRRPTECVFIEPERLIYVPVAHGEGKIVTKDYEALQKLDAEGHVAFKYVDANGDGRPLPRSTRTARSIPSRA